MTQRALITGVTGQDGSYLAEFLLAKGYEVHGIKRRASLLNTERVDHIYEDPHEPDPAFVLHYGDLSDSSNLTRIIHEVQPHEIYNHRGAVARRGQLRDARVHRRRRRARHAAPARGGALPRAGAAHGCASTRRPPAELYGLVQETPQTRDDAVLPALALRRRQALRLLDHGQLPRGLRDVRLQRHPLQPRVPPSGRDLRHAQDHPGRRADRARAAGAVSTSATWMRCATGVMPATTCAPSG